MIGKHKVCFNRCNTIILHSAKFWSLCKISFKRSWLVLKRFFFSSSSSGGFDTSGGFGSSGFGSASGRYEILISFQCDSFLCTSHCLCEILCLFFVCYALLRVISSFAIILTRKRELFDLL